MLRHPLLPHLARTYSYSAFSFYDHNSLTLIRQARKRKSQNTRQQTKMWTVNQVSNCDEGPSLPAPCRTVSASETESRLTGRGWEPREVNCCRRKSASGWRGKVFTAPQQCLDLWLVWRTCWDSDPQVYPGLGASECGLQSVFSRLTADADSGQGVRSVGCCSQCCPHHGCHRPRGRPLI